MLEATETHQSKPPAAAIRPETITEQDKTRSDDYRWMQQLDSPRMQEFLRANNEQLESVMASRQDLRTCLLLELQALTPSDEGSAGYRSGPYLYRTRFERDDDYPVFFRRRLDPPGPEEILLDENELARDRTLCVCEGIAVTPCHDHLVFALDTSGNRAFTLHFKNLATGALLPDKIIGADSHCVWAGDNRTVFYTLLEPDTYRPWQIRRHMLGTDPARDPVVYEEPDPAFRCLLLPTRSRRFILLNAYANDAEEILYLDVRDPLGQFAVFCPRRQGHQYEVTDDGRRFIVRTNWGAPDFRLCEADIRPHSAPEDWRELLPGQKGRLLEQMAVFRDHIALTGFQEGAQHLFIMDRRNGRLHAAAMPAPVCHVWLEENPTLETELVRFGFTSLKHPVTFYDYHMADRKLALVRREEIPGYDPERYVTERRWAKAPDGVSVPISVVYRKDATSRGPAPLLLFGYGEYGTNIPVYFDQSRLVLLDRGFIYAMAHVRGGSELGDHWHRAGKRLNKKNTFTDFIACAEHLADCGLARRDQLYAESLSAGGLLLGAVINMRPGLFRGVYACKPFVDPLTAMADPHLPLTSFEYDEWGHPERPDEWEYLQSYAPYDNIIRQDYPNLLITAARNDSQVPCWEPAKWAARLREHNTAATNILLKTEMAAGHSGHSGRRERLCELALLYTFLLSLAEAPAGRDA